VFDTAFHHTMPPAAYMYALPKRLYDEQGVRRFGAHGTSYRYITQKVAEFYDAPASDLSLVVAHLGAYLLTHRCSQMESIQLSGALDAAQVTKSTHRTQATMCRRE
jgi:acetate kinase